MARRHAAIAAALAAVLGISTANALTNVAIKACANSQEQLISCRQMLTLDSFQYDCETTGNAAGEECFIHECVLADDCIKAVVDGLADWAMADPLMLYFADDATAGTAQQLAPVALEVRSSARARGDDAGTGQGSDFYSVAMVRAAMCDANPGITLADTRNLRSCHSRYGDLASWAFPVWTLMSESLSEGATDVEVLENFYSASCAPSNGNHRVCTACVTADACNLSDPFAGNDGVIDCLRTEMGDIAFTDNFNAERNDLFDVIDGNTFPEFRLLCSSGCESIEDASRPGCTWGTVRPDAAFLRVDNPYAGIIQWFVSNVAASESFLTVFNSTTDGQFFSPDTVRMELYEEDMETYLGPLKEMLDVFKATSLLQSSSDAAAVVADVDTEDTVLDTEDSVTESPVTVQDTEDVTESPVTLQDTEDVTESPVTLQDTVTASPVTVPSSGRSGTPAYAIALIALATLLVGLCCGLFLHKLRRGRSIDAFYKGDMDIPIDSGLPNTDPRLDGSSGGDSPFTVGFPSTDDLPVPPSLRR